MSYASWKNVGLEERKGKAMIPEEKYYQNENRELDQAMRDFE